MEYDPDRYNSVFDTLHPYTIQLINKYWSILKFTSKEFMLDIGCGPGLLTRNVLLSRIENHLGHLVAVDVSDEMIQFARVKNSHSLISYKELDFGKSIDKETKKNILLENDGFHKIFSIYCLMLIPDQRQVAKNIFTLLKPGGEAFLVVVAKSMAFQMVCELSKSTKWKKYFTEMPEHVSYYQHLENPDKEFRNIFESEGLTVNLCALENVSVPFQDVDEFSTFMARLNTFLDSVPGGMKKDLMLDALSLLNICKDQSPVIFEYSVIIAHVSKASVV